MKLYNTLSRKLEDFTPLTDNKVRMYTCGPTVYFYQQIGNWRAFIFTDTLRRSLEYLGYDMMQVMNITDVGHLTSDEDYGEDKLEKGARRDKKTVWEVAQMYIDDFVDSREGLHIQPPEVLARATDHIPEQIAMIEKIMEHGYAYVTKAAVYFDVLKFDKDFGDYTELSRQPLIEKEVGVREEVVVDEDKRSPYDFRLWQLDQPDHQMQWGSPWGRGFPGWHIECSAMSVKYLGQPFDIHTGGIDHIPVHHTNEKAQVEAANGERLLDGKEYVQVWMHNDFLTVDGGRMGKSLGNGYTTHDLKDFIHEHLGFESSNALIAYRYLVLTSHYRNKLDFTKESFYSSFKTLFDLFKTFADLYAITKKEGIQKTANTEKYVTVLTDSIGNDLDTASVIAALHTMFADATLTSAEKIYIALEYDKVLGFGFEKNTTTYIHHFTDEQKKIIEKRIKARNEKDYQASDTLREELGKIGVDVSDTKEGSIYYRM
jgi:cysteinyl-tRNA synthetase